MTIKATELLQLFVKANKLGLTVEVREDKDGDYVIRVYEMFCPEKFDETAFITKSLDKWGYSFSDIAKLLDVQIEDKRQEEIKAEKRKELIARLTDEEKELLGVK